MKILLVEDDRATQTMLEDVLTAHHYKVEVTGDGRSALDLVREFEYDLILLDINTPGLDGVSLCKMLRAEGYDLPILLVTARAEIADRIVGLDAGADDCTIKPFNLSELLARIRALLRRGNPKIDRSIINWDRLQLNCLTNEISYDDRVLRLTHREYDILELLLLNPQRIFSRSMLIARLWELETTPTESVITSHIKSIRQKFKVVGATQDPIETIYGFGYRLRRLEEDLMPPDLETTTLAEEPQIPTQVVDALMRDLWQQFKDSFSEQIDLLATTVNTYAHSRKSARAEWLKGLDAARKAAHKLVGSLGVYGFAHGSIVARQIEDLLNPNVELTDVDIQQMQQLVADLRQEISREPQFEQEPSSELNIDQNSPNPQLSSTQLPLVLNRSDDLESTCTRTVMVVDDDPAISHRLSVVLSPWGLQVISLVDRHRFWEQLRQTTPDLLILDIEMPEFSGIELCQTVRNDPQWGNLPILFITAAQDPATIIEAFAAGGDDYIRKPIVEPELIARVLNQLEPRQLNLKLFGKADG